MIELVSQALREGRKCWREGMREEGTDMERGTEGGTDGETEG